MAKTSNTARQDYEERWQGKRRYVFVHVASEYADAIEAVKELSNLSKRSIIEAMIADKMGVNHVDLPRVRAAWSRYRKQAR